MTATNQRDSRDRRDSSSASPLETERSAPSLGYPDGVRESMRESAGEKFAPGEVVCIPEGYEVVPHGTAAALLSRGEPLLIWDVSREEWSRLLWLYQERPHDVIIRRSRPVDPALAITARHHFILAQLARAWQRAPHLPLGQVVESIAAHAGTDVWGLTDDELYLAARTWTGVIVPMGEDL